MRHSARLSNASRFQKKVPTAAAAADVGSSTAAANGSSGLKKPSRFAPSAKAASASPSSASLASASSATSSSTPAAPLTPESIFSFLSNNVLRQDEYDALLSKRRWLHDTYLQGYDLWKHLPESEKLLVKEKIAAWRNILEKRGGSKTTKRLPLLSPADIALEPLRPLVFLYGSCLAGTAFRDGDADFALTFPTSALVGYAAVAAAFAVRRADGELVDDEEKRFFEQIVKPALARGSFEVDFNALVAAASAATTSSSTMETSSSASLDANGAGDSSIFSQVFHTDGAGANMPRLTVDGRLKDDLSMSGGIFKGSTTATAAASPLAINKGFVSASAEASSSPYTFLQSSSSVLNASFGSSGALNMTAQQLTSGENLKNSGGGGAEDSGRAPSSSFAGLHQHHSHQQQHQQKTEHDITKKSFSISDLRFSTQSNFFALARVVHPQILTTFYNHIAEKAAEEGVDTDEDDVAKALKATEALKAKEAEEASSSSPTPTPKKEKKKKSAILAALEDEIPVRGSTAKPDKSTSQAPSSSSSSSPSDSSSSSPSPPPVKAKLFLHRIFRARVPIMQFAPPSVNVVDSTETKVEADRRARGAGSSSNSTVSAATGGGGDGAGKAGGGAASVDINASFEDSFDEDFDLIMNSDDGNKTSGGKTKSAATAATPPTTTTTTVNAAQSPSAPPSLHSDVEQAEKVAVAVYAPAELFPVAAAEAVAAQDNTKKKASSSSEMLIDRLLKNDAKTMAPTTSSSVVDAPLGHRGGASTGSPLLDSFMRRGKHAKEEEEGDATATASPPLPEASPFPYSRKDMKTLAAEEASEIKEKVTLTTKTFSRFFKSREEAAAQEAMLLKVKHQIGKDIPESSAGGGVGGDDINMGAELYAAATSEFSREMGALYGGGKKLKMKPKQEQEAEGEASSSSASLSTKEGGTILTGASIPTGALFGHTPETAYSLQKRDERALASTPTHKDKKEHMDLSVAFEGCRNSLLVRFYMRKYPVAIRGSLFLLKHWGRRQQILNARRGWLSPYAISIMFIHCMHQHGVIGDLLSTGLGVDMALAEIAKLRTRASAEGMRAEDVLAAEARIMQQSAALFSRTVAPNAPITETCHPDHEVVLPPFPDPTKSGDAVRREYEMIPDMMRLFFCYYGGITDPAAVVTSIQAKNAPQKGGESTTLGPIITTAPPFDFDYNVVDIRPSPDRYTFRAEWDNALTEQLGVDTSRTGVTAAVARIKHDDENGEEKAAASLSLHRKEDEIEANRRRAANQKLGAAASSQDQEEQKNKPLLRPLSAADTGTHNTFSIRPNMVTTAASGIATTPRFAHLPEAEKEELLKAARRERWHRLGHEAILIRDPYEDHSLGRSVEFFHAEAIREEFRNASGMKYGGLNDANVFLK